MSKSWSLLKIRISDLDYTHLGSYSSHSYAQQKLNRHISSICSFDDILKINSDAYLDTNSQIIYTVKLTL